MLALHSIDRTYNKRFLCRCDCGTEKPILRHHLINGHAKSCGCLQREFQEAQLAKRDMERRKQSRGSYDSMMKRCYNPKSLGYERYGGSGITVCDRWRFGENGKSGWECFYEDMGPRPEDKPTIDRKDNARGYEPDNCRWASYKEQAANKRPRTKKSPPTPRSAG